MKLSGTKKIYVMIVLFVAACALFYVFIFRWSMNAIREQSEQYAQMKETLFLLNKKRDLLRQLELEHQSVKDTAPKISAAILSSAQEDVLAFLVMLEGLEEKTGVHLSTSIADVVLDNAAGWNAFPVVTEVYGSYPNTMNFIRLLQHAPWALKIDNVEMARSDKSQLVIKEITVPLDEGDVRTVIEAKVLNAIPPSASKTK